MRLSRRHLLRGAGGVAIGLPFLGAMAESARALEPPKRFVVFFTGLGTVKSSWVPQGSETDFTFGEILAPLEPFRSKLLVLEGIDMESAYHGPGDQHQTGIAQALSGVELQAGDLFPYACGSGSVGWGGGISLDQYLAEQIGQGTKFPSLEFGAQVQYSRVSNRISYRGPAQPVPPDDDPYSAFGRIFGDLDANPALLATRRLQRRHVLDAVTDDYKALSKKIGKEDKDKIDAHLSAVEEIEKRLDAPGGLGGNCKLPTMPAAIDIYENDNYPTIGKLQMDLLAMALACDLTRVASLLWASVQSGKVFTWLGQSATHHSLSHSPLTDLDSQRQLIDIGVWHAQQFAYLLGKLDSMPEGDGTVLDNTILLWCTDISQGQSHSRRDMPYVLAGGGGGALKMGRYLKFTGDYHNNLLVSLARAMGVEIDTFGNPEYCTGALPRLIG